MLLLAAALALTAAGLAEGRGWELPAKHVAVDVASDEPTRRALRDGGARNSRRLRLVLPSPLESLELTLVRRAEGVFAPGYKHRVVGSAGEILSESDAPTCLFEAEDARGNQGIVSLCEGVLHATMGLAEAGGDASDVRGAYAVQPTSLEAGAGHALYWLRDVESAPVPCGVDHRHDARTLRETLRETEAEPSRRALASQTQWYGRFHVYNDAEQYAVYGKLTEARAAHIFLLANSLFSTYGNGSSSVSSVRIALRVVNVTTFAVDPYTVPTDSSGSAAANDVLIAFADYHAGVDATNAGFLLTGIPIQSPLVGLAFTGGMCVPSYQAAFSVGSQFSDAGTAALQAHMMGHLFGSCHVPPATRAYTCATLGGTYAEGPNWLFIMDATMDPSNPATVWGDPPAEDINGFAGSDPQCLSANPASLFNVTQADAAAGYVETCADGVRDGQETDVDCGGSQCLQCALGKNCLASTDCVGPGTSCGSGGVCIVGTSSPATKPTTSSGDRPALRAWLGGCASSAAVVFLLLA